MENTADPFAISPGTTIHKWRIVKELGRGTYGAVYKVADDELHRDAAMKVERRAISPEYRMLKVEVAVMIELRAKKVKNCVQLFDHGCTPIFNYMVMSLVGNNLESLANKIAKLNNKKEPMFSLYSAFYIGINTLDTLCDLHKCLFLHRDVKPANFAIGCHAADLTTIYLLDFGTTRRYAKENGLHHRPRAKVAFRGSTLYASANALRERDQSRRDDIWSWLFTLISLTVGKLPWSNLKMPKRCTFIQQQERYANAKVTCTTHPQLLLKGCPPEYEEVMSYMTPLLFYSRPNYEAIRNALQKGIERLKTSGEKAQLEWEDVMKKVPKSQTSSSLYSLTTTAKPPSTSQPTPVSPKEGVKHVGVMSLWRAIK
ncbi:hypothetical protein M514_14129, partial [Trichuris suis]